MNATPDISAVSMLLCFVLFVVPVIASRILGLNMIKPLFISAFRMTVQLFLVGVYLTYLFDLNNTMVTMAWLLVMVAFAALTVVRSSGLHWRVFIVPAFGALAAATVPLLLYFNMVIIRLTDIFEARFIIAIGGMVLGNAMRAIIVGVSDFYKSIKRDENRYLYSLSQGATVYEAGKRYVCMSLTAALKPSLASMATMGLVFLPGMMTGQIIGGSSPLVAIKYQIAIMTLIYVATVTSIGLTILLTIRTSFDDFGLLRKEVFSSR